MWRPVLVCVLLAGSAARAAVVTSHAADCPAVRSVLLEKGVAESALSSSGAASEVCQEGSCCSRPWELGIRDVVLRDFRSRLVDSTDQVKNLLHLQVNSVQDAILRLIHSTKKSTINNYSRDTDEDSQESDDVALHALPELFDSFMRYFQSQLSDPELEEAVTDFFDDLFVTTYGRGVQLNATLEACLREKRMLIRPFRGVPLRMQERLLRIFGLAKFYLQSLYGGLSVLNTTTQFQCSKSCYQALTRLNYCPLCRGLNEVRPCNEFCFNVMRGCMAPLSTLSESWVAYVDVLRKLATSLQAGNNVEAYLTKLYINISEATTSILGYREEVDAQVQRSCGAAAAPTEPALRRRRRRELDMQYRSSGDLGGALPPLPQRGDLIDLDADGEVQLNKLLRAFTSDVEQHRGLFQMQPEDVCSDSSQDNSQATSCWNGQDVGNYTKPVAGIGLDSQVFNPEVEVPQVPDAALKEKADLLDQIQQGSTDKLATMPPVDSYGGWDDFPGGLYDSDGASGYSSGDMLYTDDEDDYAGHYYDHDDYGHSGSGHGDDDYTDFDDGDYHDVDGGVTEFPSVHEEDTDATDLEIAGETDVLPPAVDVEPPVPATTRPTARAPPPAPTTAKPAAAAAAAAAVCWTLLAAALLVARL